MRGIDGSPKLKNASDLLANSFRNSSKCSGVSDSQNSRFNLFSFSLSDSIIKVFPLSIVPTYAQGSRPLRCLVTLYSVAVANKQRAPLSNSAKEFPPAHLVTQISQVRGSYISMGFSTIGAE